MSCAGLLAFLLVLPARAEDSVADKIKKDYVEPVFDNVSKAAKSAADPNATASPALWSPNIDGASPAARKAVDYARGKLIDPIGDELGDKAGRAAHVLGSPDANADSAGLEDSIFSFSNRMAEHITGVVRDMFSPKKTLILQPVEPLPGQEALRKNLAPVATPNDFAYRKDSTALVHGSPGAAMAGEPGLKSRSKLKPIRISR